MSRDAVEGFEGQERRQARSRRRMPGDIRELLERLRREQRRPGSRTSDGVEWRAIRLDDLQQAIGAICEGWKPEPEGEG